MLLYNNYNNILILSFVLTQVLAHFGPYAKKREQILNSIRQNSDVLGDNKVESHLPATPETLTVPKIKDIVGEALPRIGNYKELDNTKQVVALIDDVSIK